MKAIMKISFLVIGAMAAVAGAQDISGFPQCAQWCINSMQQPNKAQELGCATGDDGCLCRNPNFTYGVRDCSGEFCANATVAQQALGYANDFCRNRGVDLSTVTNAAGAAPTRSATGTATGGAGGAGGSTTSASAAISTITTGGSTIAITFGSTAISAPVNTTGVLSETTMVSHSAIVSTTVSGSSTIVTTIGTSASFSTSTSTGTGAGASGTVRTTSTSPGFAPQMTAAPAGILAAAGIAALLL